MDPYEEELQKKISALPKEVQEFLYSPDMSKAIQEVGAAHHLHIDQIGALEAETVAVMIGTTDAADFGTNVAESLQIDQNKGNEIAKQISDALFSKIQTAMKQPLARAVPINTPTPVAAPAPTPKPPVQTPLQQAKPAEPHPADMMLSQKTVQTAPAAPIQKSSTPTPVAPSAQAPTTTTPPQQPTPQNDPSKPQNYKADPYREPTN